MTHLSAPFLLRTALCMSIAATAVGCGGGGGGGGAAATGGAAAPPTTTATPAATFSSITPPAGFEWNSAQAATAGITLSRASGAELGGGIKLQLSTFTCSHPVVGDVTNPMAVDSLTGHALSEQDAALRTVTVPLGMLQVPAVITEVLVEVIEGNSTLYGKRHALSALAGLNVVFPDSTPSSQDTDYVDRCR
jgi:hypothetical protein